jgi:isoleucyl-tRNA synthetase
MALAKAPKSFIISCFIHLLHAPHAMRLNSHQGDGNAEVIAALAESGALLKEEPYEHKYPYDWRTKKPTIFRATSQWFASVAGFRDVALQAIREVCVVGWGVRV